ncbi:MAG: hypothetical protein PHC61_18855, partial [Chitinivibrionales bacterium]|nr:hypothetical protein [Chitinivibrionales bacterium]
QLGHADEMIVRMKQILAIFPQSDVADDALFEIAFYYQTIDDYQKATELYTQLAEQYPFGESYSNHEPFIDIVKEQKRLMHADALSMLKVLGFTGDNLQDLYNAFQKQNNLNVTGDGDRPTVTLIKAQYKSFLDNETRKAARAQRFKRYRTAAFIVGSLVLCNCIALLAAFSQIRAKNKVLAELRQTLLKLDTANI